MRPEAKLQGQLDYEACYLRYQCPFFSIQSKEWLPQPNFWRLLLSRRLFGPGESSHPKRAETSRDSQDGAPSHRALCAPRNPSRKKPFRLRENFRRPRHAKTIARPGPIGLCARPQHPPEEVLPPSMSAILRGRSPNFRFECVDCDRRERELAKEPDPLRETCLWAHVHR